MKIDELIAASDRASSFLKSLANAQRLRILCMMLEGEKSVGEMAEALGISHSAVSQSLAMMRREGTVRPRRDGQMIYYRLVDKNVSKMLKLLSNMFCP